MPKQNSQSQGKMDAPPVFHPGRSQKLTKKEKARRKEEREKQRKFQSQRKQKPWVFTRPPPLWRIIPCSFQYSFMIDTLKGKSYFEKMRALEDYGMAYVNYKPNPYFPNFKVNEQVVQNIQEMKKECRRICTENQILRWKFKQFITRWRIRRFKQINDNDFITLSAIEQPIKIYSFPTRSQYTFECQSILQDIHKKLLHHDGQIPNPLFPRNPYTNQDFTFPQLLSIHKQCKKYGKAVWTLEAFTKSKLCIDNFFLVQRKALRLHALKAILYNYSDPEGILLLLNFIESQHDEHGANFNKILYRWSIVRIPEEPKIQSWRSLCKEYYEEEILAEDDDERENCFLRISRKTGSLCATPHDLLVKKNLIMRL